MPGSEDDHFRVKPAAPKARGGTRSRRFVSQVLKEASKIGTKPSGGSFGRPGNTFGRGRVAAALAGQRLGPDARRVVIKSRFVVLQRASPNSVAVHLRYIERDGITRDGQKGRAYGADTDAADLKAFQDRGHGDRHQFRFIVSAEDGLELEDLRGFTRQLMRRMEVDLETRLDWVAVDHWDTDNPHTHIVLNGHTGGDGREDLVISPDYMAHGMRRRASEIATEWLGPRAEADIRRALAREVDQQRLTGLDRTLARQAGIDEVDLTGRPKDRQRQNALRARLQRLEGMGLAERVDPNRWALKPGMLTALEKLGEREDALGCMHRALVGQRRECVVNGELTSPVIGRIAGKGLVDELHERGYLVVDGVDGRAHYLKLPSGFDLMELPINGIVEVKPAGRGRPMDHNIAALARNGSYRASEHILQLERARDRDPESTVDAHVRRLEALRRSGVVERASDGVWRLPPDFLVRAAAYDATRTGSTSIEVRSHQPIEHQASARGETWLDRQLVSPGVALSHAGFGGKVRNALEERTNFLTAHGLAEQRGGRAIFARNLLTTLRDRELAEVGNALQRQTGLVYRPAGDDMRVSGVYQKSVQLVSGRFAMLHEGQGFSLVPWRPVIEKRLGRWLAATVSGSSASWQLSKQRDISI